MKQTVVAGRRVALASSLALLLTGCAEAPFTPIPLMEGTVNAQVNDPPSHSVFVHLATGTTTSVPVASWDLAFESRGGRHVLINTGKRARVLNTRSTDFAAVTSTSAATYGGSYVFETVDGDLSRAAMGADPVGTVYILDLGSDAAGNVLGHRKLRIEEYTPGTSVRIRFANPDGSGEQTRMVSLSPNHNFTYVSLASGSVVSVEPERGKWDLVITPVTVRTGPPNAPVFRLAIAALTNRYDRVQVAVDDPSAGMTVNDDPSSPRNQMGLDASRYGTLTRTDFARLGAHDAADAIGRGWLAVMQPHSAAVYKVYSFVTYLVKDAQGKHFKLRFLSFVDPATGRNGAVQFEFREIE